jgi:hypothetical protein
MITIHQTTRFVYKGSMLRLGHFYSKERNYERICQYKGSESYEEGYSELTEGCVC